MEGGGRFKMLLVACWCLLYIVHGSPVSQKADKGIRDTEIELENVLRQFLNERSDDDDPKPYKPQLLNERSDEEDPKPYIPKGAQMVRGMGKIQNERRNTHPKREQPPNIKEMTKEETFKEKSKAICEGGTCHMKVDESFVPKTEKNDKHEKQKPNSNSQRKRYIDYSGNGLWTDGVIPYDASSLINAIQSSDAGSQIFAYFNDGIELFHSQTCIKWRQRVQTDGVEYVQINGTTDNRVNCSCGCFAGVGKFFGRQTPISLDVRVSGGCHSIGVVLHEMMHVIDGSHEQSREDRGEALTINWKNIQASVADNYFTGPRNDILNSTASELSLASMLMYSRKIFRSNTEEDTFTVKDKDLEFLTEENKNTFSFYDRESITKVYQCGKDCGSTACNNGGFATKTVDDSNCKCVCPEHLTGSSCDGLTGNGACSRTIDLGQSGTDTIKTLSSPYTTDRKCVYLVRASPGSRIKFDLNNMDIDCNLKHYLEIRYHLIGEPSQELCGTIASKTLMTGANTESHLALVIFDTSASSDTTTKTGFTLTVTAVKSGCFNRPCKNGGTCSEDATAGEFICACPQGIGGKDCSQATGTVSCNEGVDNDIHGECFLENLETSAGVFAESLNQGNPNEPPAPADGLTYYALGFYDAILVSDVTFPDAATLCVRFKAIVNDPSGSSSQLSLMVSDNTNPTPRNLLVVSNTGLTSWVSQEYEISPSSNRKIYFNGKRGDRTEMYLDDISVFQGKCDLCSPNPCDNGGSCSQTGNTWQCTCTTGYQGDTCSDVVACLANTCRGRGNCVNTNGVLSCNCNSGFVGQFCEFEDLCSPNPCNNGGSCSQINDEFKCTCPSGFWGTTCDVDDLCLSSNPCQNGATCIQTGVDTFCNCVSGSYGNTCAQTDVCSASPCQNGGICKNLGGTDFYCDCPSGLLGDLCYDSGTECSFEVDQSCPFQGVSWDNFDWIEGDSSNGPTSAVNGGKYMYISNNDQTINHNAWLYATSGLPTGENCLTFSYIMFADPGIFGVYSSLPSENTLASIWFTRGESFNTYKVGKVTIPSGHTKVAIIVTLETVDNSGYVALDSVRIYPGACDECSPNVCQNGGTCSVSNGAVTCSCLSGYSGTFCSSVTPVCVKNPCRNGGTCSGTADSFNCACASGFSGLMCENSVSGPCANSPCQHGGICSVSGSTFTCECPPAYTGNICDTNNACFNNPCQNSGTCTTSGSSYTCTCSAGNIGTNCDVDDPCQPNPCQNNGACSVSGSSYTCSCTSGFSGTDCEVDDPCVPNPCQNSGTCTGSGSSYTCNCASGFSGDDCDVSDQLMYCSFEDGESDCGLTDVTFDYFDWTLQSGSTPSTGTGPNSAYVGSNYKYIEVSGQGDNTYAILQKNGLSTGMSDISPPQTWTGFDKCLRFHFHKLGQADALQVYGNSFALLWGDYTLNYGVEWQSASVTIDSSYDTFYIVGWRGNSWQGDIAIDDVKLVNGPCN